MNLANFDIHIHGCFIVIDMNITSQFARFNEYCYLQVIKLGPND